MSVPFEKLLESVARELAHEVRFSENFQPSAEVILKRHLLPLFQAGQVMREALKYRKGLRSKGQAWDAERERLGQQPKGK